MGQTLTHGIYLPDEGERNCYNGLAGNWQLLDGAVGTIAEHTSALAGKAPLVHTHVKADITDFPAYGNAAGTICEGNDSRLSDARTPVAHIHGKADITDLFNSANTWSAVNQHSREIQLAGDRNAYIAPMWSGVVSGIAFLSMDAGKQFVFGQRTTDANNRFVYDATKGYLVLKTGVIGESNYVEVTPHGSDTRLGDSTNKWKTLNGINPGALSLPSDNYSTANLDPTNWNTTGSENTYTAPSDGWLGVQVQSADALDLSGQYVFIGRTTGGTNFYSQSVLSHIVGTWISGKLTGCVLIPVISGKTYAIRIKIGKTQQEGSIIYARFYTCLGNV